MSRLRAFFAGILLAVVGFASINGIAYAATGSGLILGHHNSADTTTTLSRTTAGPALALHVKAHHAPFTVNSNTQVPKLNASSVDGLHASALETHDRQFNLPKAGTAAPELIYDLSTVPAGTYYVSWDVVGDVSASGDLLNCALEQQTVHTPELLAYGSSFETFSTVHGGGVVTVAAGKPLQLRCFMNTGNYTIDSAQRSIVDFVKIDSAVGRDLVAPLIAHTRVQAHRNASGR